jgi:hypothetical protein
MIIVFFLQYLWCKSIEFFFIFFALCNKFVKKNKTLPCKTSRVAGNVINEVSLVNYVIAQDRIAY